MSYLYGTMKKTIDMRWTIAKITATHPIDNANQRQTILYR